MRNSLFKYINKTRITRINLVIENMVKPTFTQNTSDLFDPVTLTLIAVV